MTDLCVVTDYLECLFVKLNTNGSSYVVGVVYRPPNSNITLFNEKNERYSQQSVKYAMLCDGRLQYRSSET